MAKDSFWFKHDANASRDIKLMEIKAIYGMAGLGMFWCTIEVLREQNNYIWKDDEKSIQILGTMIGCDVPKYNGFITDCKRIGALKSENGYLFSDRLISDMAAWESKKNNRSGKKSPRKDNGSGTDSERILNGIGTEPITDLPQGRGEVRREEERRGNGQPDLNSVFSFFHEKLAPRVGADQAKESAKKFIMHVKDWKNWESGAEKWISNEKTVFLLEEPSQLKKSTEV